jgi:putative flippase GtrA
MRSLLPEGRALTVVFIRFAVVGMANTFVGFAIILLLQLGLAVDARAANAMGYGAGFVLGFILNRNFVFTGADAGLQTLLRYAFAALAAFLINQVVLAGALPALGASRGAALLAQGAAVGSGTVVFFALCRSWVFRRLPSAAGSRVRDR